MLGLDLPFGKLEITKSWRPVLHRWRGKLWPRPLAARCDCNSTPYQVATRLWLPVAL